MHTTNVVPTIVQRGARRATRWVGLNISPLKTQVHRAYRRRMRVIVDNVAKGFTDWDDYDDHAPESCTLTAWDVW